MSHREAEQKIRLKALREAARIGIAAIDAGRFRTFDSPVELDRHFASMIDETVSGKGSGTRSK